MKYIHSLFIAIFLLGFACTSHMQPLATPVEIYYKAILPLTNTIRAIASDWDNVVSIKDRWTRWTGTTKAVLSKIWLATKLFMSTEIKDDIFKSWNFKIKDFNGDTIYGVDDFVDYFAQKYHPSIIDIKQQLVDAFTAVKPIRSTISLYQELAIPVVVWTNNNFISYQLKLKSLNHKLNFTRSMPFEPVAVFVAGKNSNVSDEIYDIQGKPYESYFLKAYYYTKKQLNLNDNDIVAFIDDLAENIDAAREVAKKHNLPLIAIQYTTPEQLEYDFGLLMESAGDVVFTDMNPKELDDYLFYREDRVK